MGKVQSKVIRLEKLLLVEPYKIVGLWSNGETRINDFSEEVDTWRTGHNRELKKLTNRKIFETAFVKEGTLAFAGSTVQVLGMHGDQPVDFDRQVLYKESQLIGNVVSYEEAISHQKKRAGNRKRRVSALAHLEHKPSDSYFFSVIPEQIKQIDLPITQLIVIGGELIEIDS